MEEFHASSVVPPLGKYHSTSTIASSRLRLAAVRGAVYPQSCRRERFAARRRLAADERDHQPDAIVEIPRWSISFRTRCAATQFRNSRRWSLVSHQRLDVVRPLLQRDSFLHVIAT